MLKNITIGQYIAGDSFIHKMDPRAKILATVIYMILLFMIKDANGYIAVTILSLLIAMVSKVPLTYYYRGLKPLLIIVIFTTGMHFFLTPGEELWSWGLLTITKEGIRQGVFMGLRLILLVTMTSVLTLTTTPISLTDGIESILNPFKKLGVPAHELAMMMSIALRFIPTLIEETDKIMNAQKARGADFESGSIVQRGKALIPLLVPLFISSFRRADDLAVAMEARCYRGGENRTSLRKLEYTKRDFFGLVILVICLGISMYV